MRSALISTKPFIFDLFLVGVTVQSAESLSPAIPLGTSTKRANSKRANHGRPRLFRVENLMFPFISVPPLAQGSAAPTYSKKEQFPFPPGFQVHGSTVCDALPPHSRPRPILPAAKRARFKDAVPPHAPLASPLWDPGSSAWMLQNALPSVPSSSTPLRCTTAGSSIVPLEPLARRLEAWLALPSPSRWLTRTIQLGYAIQFARRPPKFSGVLKTSVAARNAPVLREEIAVLLAKDAIEPVPPAEMSQGFYSPFLHLHLHYI